MGNEFESRRGEAQVTEVDFGPIPENPSNASDKDIKALEEYYEQHPDQFPSGKYLDVKEWENWRDISIQYKEDNNKWNVSYRGFFNDEEVVQEFGSEEEAQQELDKLQDYNKQIALDLIREARNFAIGEDLEAPWTDSVDVSAETLTPVKDTTPIDSVPERLADDERVSEDPTPVEYLEVDQDPTGDEVSKDKLPGAEALQAELDRLIEESVEKENNKVTETVGKLARIEGREYTGEPDIETNLNALELDIFRERAQEAINKYQKFHNSFPKEYRTPEIQEQYRRLEKEAWDRVEALAYKLGGRIIELPRGLEFKLEDDVSIDIKTRDRLNSDLYYKFNQERQITHIEINGNTIQLNRPRTVDELLNGDRPARILYHSGEQILNEDPSKKHYKGYWIKGLNPNTIQDMERELSGNQFPQPDIIDETITPSDIIDNPDSIQYYRNLEPIDLSEINTTQESNVPPIMPIFQVEQGTPNFDSKEKYSLGDEGVETTPQVLLDNLRLDYARAEEAWNRKPGDGDLEDAFMVAREAYNTELERVLKLQVAEGQADNISKMFKDEVMSLRDSRIEQSQELQGKWEKRLNPIKEKFVNFVIKNKKFISRLNLAAGVAGGALALTGVGIPLAGGLAVARRMVSATLLGVSTGEEIRSLGEDADINSFWGKIKFQAVIPKLVQESLASSEDEFKQVSEDVLKERLGTLEAYYRLNGGKFTNDNQQQSYEKVLTELARRVQENVIYAENPNLSIQPLTPEQLEKNKKLYGWGASYELAKIAKSQNVDLSLLSREDYADFAIQNKLMIEDTQLRMSPWQRMCESVDEVREGDKERQSLINPEADAAFDKFSLEMRQKAGEDNRNIDNNIIVRQGTNSSDQWLFFGINQGADSREDQIFKSYISLQDLNTLTPDKFTDFMKALRDSGYNGDIKVFQDLLSQGIRLNDQIVMHGASEADAKLGLDVADQFFGDSLADKSLGIDKKINGKRYSYSQILAQNIKNSIQDSSSVEEQNPSTEVLKSDRQELETDRYTSELLNTISDTRIAELDKFRRKRKIATGAGIAVGLLAGGAVHILDEVNKPDSVELTDSSGSPTGGATPDTQAPGTGPGGASAPEAGAFAPPEVNPTPSPEIPPTGAGAEEALRQAQEAAAATEQAQELARDVSSLDSGETIWSQASKWLGPDASQGQIQEAVEKYLGSIKGQDTIFNLAQQTEGGRELLSQWGVDDAGEMAGLSKDQLFEISRYLAPGELEGLTELSLDNLDALEQAVAPEVTEALTIEPTSPKPPSPTAGPEITGSEPPAPPSAEAPVPPPSPVEVPPVASTEFIRGVSEALGTTNLTEAQLQEVIHSFATSEQGSVDLYNQIISNEEGARFLSGFGVNNAADFANLRPDEVYEIAQTVGLENLDKLPGFELNEIILSKFEDAPDVLNLVNGAKPLTLIDSYIAQYAGDLPGSRSIGKLALEEYVLNTDDGRKWLYGAIVDNKDKTSAGAENLQKVRELFSRESIKSPDDLKRLLVDSRGYPSARLFWDKLSWVLNPGPMPGIKEAVKQVLTRQ